MKTPSLLKAIAADLADGHAAIVQLVSTAESLMERRLSEIPTEEWGDLSIDVTPKRICTRLFEPRLSDPAL